MAGFSKHKYFKLAKGFTGRSKNCLRVTIPRVEKSLQKAYVGRKLRPRILRTNWIQNINSAARDLNISYSQLVCGLNRSNVILDRKILSELAQYEPYSFKAVIDEIKIQNEIITKQKHHRLEDMIKRNLITNAKLQPEDYHRKPKNEVKVKYLIDEEKEPTPMSELFEHVKIWSYGILISTITIRVQSFSLNWIWLLVQFIHGLNPVLTFHHHK